MDQAVNLLSNEKFLSSFHAVFLLALGYVCAKLLSSLATKVTSRKLTNHGKQILRRVVFSGVFILFAISALKQLGLDLSIILGAAGILTVAIGFASQTSASNLISGLFLMIERPFSIGDIIRVGTTTGEVISIDLLSVKLRTFDNLFVRIPNETMIKTEVVTLTRFPIRRVDLLVGVAYKENIAQVKEILMDIAKSDPLCLEEPVPLFILTGFGNSSVDIQFSVWAKRENFLALKNTMIEEIKTRFDAQGIEIPFPHMSFYTGLDSQPLPIKLVNDTNSESTSAKQNEKP